MDYYTTGALIIVRTPTTTQPQHSSWVGHKNDFANPNHPPTTTTETQHQPLGAPYGSSGPGRRKSWTNVTIVLRVKGCYGQRKAKMHTLSRPTI